MTTAADDKAKILYYINELPQHDGTLPINDAVEDGVLTKGAHGAVYAQEKAIAGMIKAYAVSERMRAIADNDGKEGFNTDKALAEIATIVSSMDGGRKVTEAKIIDKIDELDLGLKGKTAVLHIVENKDRSEIMDDIKAALPGLKQDAPSAVFDDEVKNAAQAKFYQITDTNLFNQSSVRLGYVPDASNPNEDGSLPMRATHLGGQQAVEDYSNDAIQKQNAIANFLENLEKTTERQHTGLFTRDESKTINVFDIGHGDGETAVSTLKKLQELNPGIHINYTGMEILPGSAEETKKAFEETGLTNVTANFITGTFGLKKGDAHFKENDDKLEPYLGKQDLVIASHVYNFDAPSFLEEIAKLQKPDGIAYIAHESADSWLGEIRKANKEIVRQGNDRAADLRGQLDTQGRTQDYETFSVPTTDTLKPLTEKEMAILKGAEQGDYTANRTARMTPEEHDTFIDKRDVLESYLRAPVEAFSNENRGKLLDAFQAKLIESEQGKPLLRNSETEIVLSPGHSQELHAAVKQAAEATGRQMNPPAKTWGEQVQERGDIALG